MYIFLHSYFQFFLYFFIIINNLEYIIKNASEKAVAGAIQEEFQGYKG